MASSVRKTEIKIEELCRTCLSKDNELHSIFDICIGTITLDYVVTSITGLEISKNDGLPSTICCDCKEKAAKAFDFKKRSEEALISLQDIFKKEKKDWSTSRNNTMGVKTEDLSSLEQDDYTDSDFNISLTGGPDLNDLEPVKSESDMGKNKTCYECKKCLVIFETLEKYEDHQKKKCIKIECDDSNSTYCPLCGTCYDGAANLTKHMWKYHADVMGPKKRGRPKKLLTSTILDKLSENGLYVASSKQMECSVCKQYFKTKEDLGTHLISHKDMLVLCCVLCKKMYLDRKMIDQHSCLEEKNLSNEQIIEKKFMSEITLQQLIEAHNEMNFSNVDVTDTSKDVEKQHRFLVTLFDFLHNCWLFYRIARLSKRAEQWLAVLHNY